MRLVVIDSAKNTYTVFEGRTFVAEFQSYGPLPAEEVEHIRVSPPPPLEAA